MLSKLEKKWAAESKPTHRSSPVTSIYNIHRLPQTPTHLQRQEPTNEKAICPNSVRPTHLRCTKIRVESKRNRGIYRSRFLHPFWILIGAVSSRNHPSEKRKKKEKKEKKRNGLRASAPLIVPATQGIRCISLSCVRVQEAVTLKVRRNATWQLFVGPLREMRYRFCPGVQVEEPPPPVNPLFLFLVTTPTSGPG